MDLRPMLATLADAPLRQKGLVYEPKYDGIRALVELVPTRKGTQVQIWSRNGNEKTAQFPAIVRALAAAGAGLKAPVLLDGEIAALDERGRPAGFQRLQGRMHLLGARDVERAEEAQPATFIAFDLLREGKEDLTRLPLTERRKRLEQIFDRIFRLKAEATGTRPASGADSRRSRLKAEGQLIRLSEQVADDGTGMYQRAVQEKWEGLIAKDASSTYQPGRRSPAWRKIKLLQEQEFVVGGWTEPRETRQYFGALLLGVHEDGRLKYVGHTGTGFDQKELARVSKLLRARETKTSPFAEGIKTNEPAHWVRPDLVAQIRFTEWTADDKLRHPVYLGLRDDKSAATVTRERPVASATTPVASTLKRRQPSSTPVASSSPRVASAFRRKSAAETPGAPKRPARKDLDGVIDQLRALEDSRRDGEIALPNGDKVKVTNLAKLFWPALKITKGDLLRYYVEVSPYLLPCVEDRPLVMKRFPNGVGGKAFYQQRSREERPPAGVRIETLEDRLDPIGEPDAKRLIGGSLTTLLYMTQIAAISQDPWFSRVQSPLDADYCAIDLDPTDTATFEKVLDVARWVRDELASMGVPGFPKTSGSSGLHIYIPLPPHTSYESGQLFCQIVATLVATRHPKTATVERAVARRPRGTVYVDFLQNILGKTLATAYSARASDYAGVSTPVTWKEVDGVLDPRAFTIRTAPARFRAMGDIWEGLRTRAPADLKAVFEKYAR
jgi:bifunctional non-homologous end joining protein LigD